MYGQVMTSEPSQSTNIRFIDLNRVQVYEAGAMLITSNRSVAEWGTVFADPVVATAILDRLLHHSHVLTIRGDSYRLRAKRKSGLIRPPAGDGAPVGSASLRPVTGGNEHQPRS